MTDNRAEEVKMLARDYAELAIATCVAVASNEDEKGAARVMAAKELLARGFGAPERRVEQRVDHHIYDERQAHLTALQKLAEERRPMIEDASYREIKDGK